MPATLPDGTPVPADGSLPPSARAHVIGTSLGIYLHVPYCRTRCGYCDFNTYTADELGRGAARADWAATAIAELALADRVLGPDRPPVSTVFVGGGTPTLLPPEDLVRVLNEIDRRFGLAPGAEVTTESNPDSIDARGLAQLRAGGFTRVSFGMQSADRDVLRLLDREHTPGRAQAAVAEARTAGFDSISLDLIYGTPGETVTSWSDTLNAALEADPDHVSAYALIIEQGTRLAVRIRRGEVPVPEDDDLADKYLLTEERLSSNGYGWYEVSNWARTPADRCQHNLAYWRGGTWWGIGPGAHSHVGGVRFWNVKHPSAWAQRLGQGISPGHGREVLTAHQRRLERVLLELRLVDGLDIAVLTDTERQRLEPVTQRGLATMSGDRIVLTLQGRLLADGVVRDLLD